MKLISVVLLAIFAWPILFMAGCCIEPLHHGFEEGWNLSKKWRINRETERQRQETLKKP